MILSDRKEKLAKPNHRLMLMLSAFDILASTAYLMTTLAFPRESEIYGAMGNDNTCTAQGFSILLGLAVPMYNASLCLFFVLTIRYRLPPTRFSATIEPFLHTFSVLIPFTLALLSALAGDIKQGPFVICYLDDSSKLRFVFFGVLLICLMVCICSMVLICCHVSRQSNAMIRYAYGLQMQRREAEKQDTIRQALLYTSAFIVTWCFPMVLAFYCSYPLVVLMEILYPLQGFWNFLLYIRPGVSAIKKENPEKSIFGVICEVVFHSKERSNQRRESLTRGSMISKQTFQRVTGFNGNMKRSESIQFEETKHEIISDKIVGEDARTMEESNCIKSAGQISNEGVEECQCDNLEDCTNFGKCKAKDDSYENYIEDTSHGIVSSNVQQTSRVERRASLVGLATIALNFSLNDSVSL